MKLLLMCDNEGEDIREELHFSNSQATLVHGKNCVYWLIFIKDIVYKSLYFSAFMIYEFVYLNQELYQLWVAS